MKLKLCMCGGQATGPKWEIDAIPPPHDKRYGIRCQECGIRLLGATKESVTIAWDNRPGERAARVEGMEILQATLSVTLLNASNPLEAIQIMHKAAHHLIEAEG